MKDTAQMARGKWGSILTKVGGFDEHVLNGRHHPCPCSQSGTDRFRFSNLNGSGNYFCACSDGEKDGFGLLECKYGWDFKRSCLEIERVMGTTPYDNDVRKAKDVERARADIKWVLQSTGDIRVWKAYLRNRGITAVLNDVRAVKTRYGLARQQVEGEHEAMASIIRDSNGTAVSVHLTYLNGAAKADFPSPRIVMTPVTTIKGGAIRLLPVEDGVLGIGEGIESSLSAAILFNMPVWATISAGGMQNFELPVGGGVKHLHVFADNDASYTGQAAAFALAKRLRSAENPIEVTVHIPSIVGDYNDVLMHG